MKLRKVKKRLKRKVGEILGIEPVSGSPMRVVGVKVIPTGGKRVSYRYVCEPVCKELFEEARKGMKPQREKLTFIN